jgi:hypothetical protein
VKLGLVFGSVVFLIAGITIAGNSQEVTGLSDLELTNIGANATANATAETQTYQNPDIGIRFSYPSDWGKMVEKGENCTKSCVLVLERSSNTYPFNFVILAQSKESCNCNSLTDFVKYVYMGQQAIKGFIFINDNSTTVAKKYPGWQIESSNLNEDNDRANSLNVMTTPNNESYFSIGTSYLNESLVKSIPEFKNLNESQAKFLSQFKNVIDSIEFLPIKVAKTPSFMNMNETQESKSSTNIDNNTIIEKTLPPIAIGNTQASLYTKVSPPDKKQDALFQLRLIDNKTGKDITNVNYFLTITKGNNQLLRELFYSKDGPLTLKFEQNQSPVTVNGTTEPFLGGWTSETGPITVSGPVLTEGGQYSYTVEIFGIDNVRNIFKPENAPRFDSSFSMKMNETEQTKPSLPLESNPNGLQILSHNSFIDSIGYFHVVGEVMNNTPTVAQFVQVSGTFYDSNNQVVDTQFTFTNPSDIGAGQKAPFDLTLLSASIPVSQVDHYNLVANSQ